ncbi:MAG: PQQ-like beta-propeller repeat protein, partial [Acidobacteriota bacterium]|nr:PQQ-like beta-propeller repeat protein [Acidobacteriota bacterium]
MRPLSVARCVVLSGAIVFIAAIAPLGADEWARFRGPNGSGVSSAARVPTEFGPETNVAWKSAVPFGRSSPVVTAERIFLTAVDDDKLVTLAFERATGRVLWRREIVKSHTADLYKDTNSATPSPASDGENVYAFFHESGLVSYDAYGALRWHKRLGPFRNYYGIAS